jgi:hypothetical protein
MPERRQPEWRESCFGSLRMSGHDQSSAYRGTGGERKTARMRRWGRNAGSKTVMRSRLRGRSDAR